MYSSKVVCSSEDDVFQRGWCQYTESPIETKNRMESSEKGDYGNRQNCSEGIAGTERRRERPELVTDRLPANGRNSG